MSIHDDTLQGLQEVLKYAKGELALKETTVEISDDEIQFYNIYSKLSDEDKVKVINYVNELLYA